MKISGSRMEQGLKLHRKGTQGNSVAIALKGDEEISERVQTELRKLTKTTAVTDGIP